QSSQSSAAVEQKESRLFNQIHLILGYSIGIIGTIMIALIGRLFPTNIPIQGAVSALDSYLPPLAGLNQVEFLVLLTLIFALAAIISDRFSSNWTRRWPLGAVFLCIFGLALAGVSAQDFPSWIITGLTGGLYLFFIYPYLIR